MMTKRKGLCAGTKLSCGQFVWWAVASLIILASSVAADQYFIGEGPIVPYDMGPFSVRIYKLDTLNKGLDVVWSPSEGDYFSGVTVCHQARTAIVLTEPHGYKPTDRVYLVPFDSVSVATRLAEDLRETGSSLSGYDYVDNGDGRAFLRLHTYSQPGSASSSQIESTVIDPSTGRTTHPSALSASAITRLASSGTAQSHWLGTVRRVDLELQGDMWRPREPEHLSVLAPVPNSVIDMKSPFAWMQVFNEPAYDILQSVPERGGLTSREFLIHARSSGSWSSLIIPGASTKLSSFGDWLGGVVMDPDPNRDYEKRFGGPPVPREDVVLVEPLEGRFFTVHLGKDCRLLSIEGDTVLYRVGKKLYRARIQDEDFVDRQFILEDSQVFGIGWAFSGGE